MGIDDDRWGHLERSCEILLIYSFLLISAIFGGGIIEKISGEFSSRNGI